MIPRRPRPQIIQGSIIRISKPNDVNREWVVTHIPDGRYLTGADVKVPKVPKENQKKAKPDGEQRSPAPRVVKKSAASTAASPAQGSLPPPLAIPPVVNKTVKKSKKRSRPKPEHATPLPAGKVFESVLVTDVEIELDFLEAYKYYAPEGRPGVVPQIQEYVDSDATASDSEGCKQRKAHADCDSDGDNEEKDEGGDTETSIEGYDSTPQKQHYQRPEKKQLHESGEEEGKFSSKLHTRSPAKSTRLDGERKEQQHYNSNSTSIMNNSNNSNGGFASFSPPRYANYGNYPEMNQAGGGAGYNLDHPPSRYSQYSSSAPNYLPFPYQQ